MSRGETSFSQHVFGVTDTVVMVAYHTGGVDQPAARGTRITTTAATASTTTYLPPPPHNHKATMRKHINHQNNHHELAPQRQYYGQGWEEIRIKRLSRSGSISRSLAGAWAAGRE